MRHHVILPTPRLRQARQQLVEQGALQVGGVDFQVERSWRRSLSAGISPIGRLDCVDNLSAPGLQQLRLRNHDLISHSGPIMEFLYEQVRESHSMVVLSDAQGVLMQTHGDLDFLSKADRVALRCGASWAESQRGTNAIGTALAEGEAIEIHGAEHYLDRNGFLTCAAAPIFSAHGQLMGILDISGDHRSRHPHTLGLVSTAAQMIENSLIMASCRHQFVVQLHARPEGIGSVAQGVLVFSEDGWLVGANRKGLELAGLERADLQATSWPQLFEAGFESCLAAALRHPEKPVLLQLRRGPSLYSRVHNPWAGSGASSRRDSGDSLLDPTLRTESRTGPGQPPGRPPADPLDQLDSGDARWRGAAQRARRVVDKGIPLVISGESGVGKELFAQALHRCSQRAAQAFVAVNCAALPDTLIEAELFGYVAGAYTGASRQGSAGRLRDAHGGTLFLDEIGDMPLGAQTRLLRVLQERRVTPLGSSTSVPVDFTLICATHQNLREAVAQGRFRSDLYYRINGLTLTLPALRERSDLDALCARLLREFSADSPLSVAPALLHALRAYSWPGNLRQLAHALRTAVALLEPHESQIDWVHLPDDLVAELQATEQAAPVGAAARSSLHDLSLKAVLQAIESARGNVSAAARHLGISRQTVYRKLQEAHAAARSSA